MCVFNVTLRKRGDRKGDTQCDRMNEDENAIHHVCTDDYESASSCYHHL